MIVEELFGRLGLKINEEQWARGDKLVEKLKTGLEIFAASEVLRGVKDIVMGVVELGSSLNDTAQKTGLTVEGLQFLGFVAKQNSSSMEDLADASKKFSKGLDEANTKGSGPVAEGLKRLGINFHSASFKANSLDEQIQLVADHLAKLPDGTKKTALAMDLFGRSGANLIPTLNDLGKNGDGLRASFQELGGGLSTDQAADLDTFGDDIDKAKFSIGALKNQIVVSMLPTLRAMLTEFLAWVKANRAVIASGIETAIKVLVGALKLAGAAVGAVADVLQYFQEHADTARAVVLALGIVLGAFAVDAAVAWLVGFAPIIAIIAAITGLILLVQHLGEVVDEVFGSLGDTVGDAKKMLELEQQGYTAEAAAEQIKSERKAKRETIDQTAKVEASPDFQGTPTTLGGAAVKQLQSIQNQYSFGDNVISVQATQGMDETALAEQVAKHVDAKQKDMLRQAMSAVKGGRP